ncbi:MAG: pyruvate kinase, partial [Thiomargarita sp.]|nr:pyruvate kinase [Thiomargarita sp.]
TRSKMTLYKGVYPIRFEELPNIDSLQANKFIIEKLQKRGAIQKGDFVIITKGDFKGISGGTNLMKIVCVGE